MAEEYKAAVDQKKGYAPHGDETAKRVGELKGHLDSFAKTPIQGVTKATPKQEVRVKK